ncbi:uncharacterized protein SAPINGB_P003638 [Magnusiomyces paraingens]|uniref:cAMP-independent regulatory protein pac2 n=1 Tax=Magnusiomyces paraingens TaxID=2606893 RepID=A0A5E8BXU2_9ASCO|nr:uncharacterized protein SAPINGB_P003638 [Saprochaete ingens]VVT53565.1 unnamed protein product [Saprochaete ingens]
MGTNMETYFGHVRTPLDAIYLFEACRLGILPRVQRRLSEKERQAITSGSVFVWDEREAGMRRWTDGKSWSASRVSGSFLTYREMEGKRNDGSSQDLEDDKNGDEDSNVVSSVSDGFHYKPDGLMKQSFSIQTTNGLKLHLISYYSRSYTNSNKLMQPSLDPKLKDIHIPPSLYPDSNTPIEGPTHMLSLPMHQAPPTMHLMPPRPSYAPVPPQHPSHLTHPAPPAHPAHPQQVHYLQPPPPAPIHQHPQQPPQSHLQHQQIPPRHQPQHPSHMGYAPPPQLHQAPAAAAAAAAAMTPMQVQQQQQQQQQPPPPPPPSQQQQQQQQPPHPVQQMPSGPYPHGAVAPPPPPPPPPPQHYSQQSIPVPGHAVTPHQQNVPLLPQQMHHHPSNGYSPQQMHTIPPPPMANQQGPCQYPPQMVNLSMPPPPPPPHQQQQQQHQHQHQHQQQQQQYYMTPPPTQEQPRQSAVMPQGQPPSGPYLQYPHAAPHHTQGPPPPPPPPQSLQPSMSQQSPYPQQQHDASSPPPPPPHYSYTHGPSGPSQQRSPGSYQPLPGHSHGPAGPPPPPPVASQYMLGPQPQNQPHPHHPQAYPPPLANGVPLPPPQQMSPMASPASAPASTPAPGPVPAPAMPIQGSSAPHVAPMMYHSASHHGSPMAPHNSHPLPPPSQQQQQQQQPPPQQQQQHQQHQQQSVPAAPPIMLSSPRSTPVSSVSSSGDVCASQPPTPRAGVVSPSIKHIGKSPRISASRVSKKGPKPKTSPRNLAAAVSVGAAFPPPPAPPTSSSFSSPRSAAFASAGSVHGSPGSGVVSPVVSPQHCDSSAAFSTTLKKPILPSTLGSLSGGTGPITLPSLPSLVRESGWDRSGSAGIWREDLRAIKVLDRGFSLN